MVVQFLLSSRSWLADNIVALLAFAVSLAALWVSLVARRDSRRQHSDNLQPNLDIAIEPSDQPRFRKRAMGPEYCWVAVHNAGPGVARNVEVRLRWEGMKKPTLSGGIGHLDRGEQKALGDEICLTAQAERVWGTMACRDIAGDRYWWHRAGPDAEWDSGMGEAPSG